MDTTVDKNALALRLQEAPTHWSPVTKLPGGNASTDWSRCARSR